MSSLDGGATWTSKAKDATHFGLVDLHFFTPDTGYVTGTNNVGRAVMIKTTDGGETWEEKKTNNTKHYWKMGFTGKQFDYAVCWNGPDLDRWIQTYDGGDIWTEQVFSFGSYEANGIGFFNDEIGWVGGGRKTYVTVDRGALWVKEEIDAVYGDYINRFIRVNDSVVYASRNRINIQTNLLASPTDQKLITHCVRYLPTQIHLPAQLPFRIQCPKMIMLKLLCLQWEGGFIIEL